MLTAVVGGLVHAPWLDLILGTCLAGGVGGGVIAIRWSVATSRALRVARAEIARLAVEAERLRFARDLHDLLGHDLAHIALKSELAEALVPTAPEQAVVAIREIGQASRASLRTARAAVAGYRQPTLAAELRNAAQILNAAGIEYRQGGEEVSAPPAVEAVLAWAVREGVTNTVKYSQARSCTVRLTETAEQVGVEIHDDGMGYGRESVPASGPGGSGLAGLAERATALGGYCAAGPRPEGGFHLQVALPVGEPS